MPQPPSLRKNVASLYAVQIASYAAPLATLPWLTRVLGPAGFGQLAFCSAVIAYFVLFADYGFNYSATRAVALHSHDRVGRSKVFWNTIIAKALLATAGFPCLLLLTVLFDKFAAERPLLLINYLTVLGTVLTPTWYFQGTERQTVLSGITIAVRLISVPAVFMLVRSTQDLRTAVAISSGLPVIGGVLCLAFLFKDEQIDALRLDGRDLIRVLQDGWHLFVSTASISLYGATNSVVLGLLAGNTAVGHYSAAEKLIQAAQGMLVPINQSFHASRASSENPGTPRLRSFAGSCGFKVRSRSHSPCYCSPSRLFSSAWPLAPRTTQLSMFCAGLLSCHSWWACPTCLAYTP
jgi:PST family polysaccharide transporter